MSDNNGNGKLAAITSKTQILEAIEPRKSVDVPEWDLTIWLRQISVADQKQIEDISDGETPAAEVLMRVLVMSITDESGNLIFNDGDIPELKKRSAAVCLRLANDAMEFNGLNKQDIDDMRSDFTKTRDTGSDTG